ncbi:cbb3-type cytochrome oxidase assembly protein CcoS [Halomonas korlensis]|uniref:Cytochrome oxidase maturation protein, cbb3-type n=1 Tax=Halomonas korlensis TaxID=463301 RepID=A0A1I7JFV4_9GAMM|nr:cbb3-type cytochrome oxidase assembly protein CcoS [Halomonas korlensis]SFU84058.1 cytochrome oxidase maturation protein, cbb3-type [Halomonas korlensis]
MSILYLLIPLSLSLLGLAVWAFFWAVKHDQFDDLEGPAYRILFDEDENDLPPEARKRRQQPDSDDAEDAQDNPGIDTGTDNASTDSTRMDRDT